VFALAEPSLYPRRLRVLGGRRFVMPVSRGRLTEAQQDTFRASRSPASVVQRNTLKASYVLSSKISQEAMSALISRIAHLGCT
jgi:hypothetical protein